MKRSGIEYQQVEWSGAKENLRFCEIYDKYQGRIRDVCYYCDYMLLVSCDHDYDP